MSGQLNFTTPDKICPKCGDVIPVAGDMVIKNGRQVRLTASRLICECHRTGTPRPSAAKLRKGETHEDQATILTPDCPVIHL